MLDFQDMFSELFELEDPMDKYEWIIDYGAGTVGIGNRFTALLVLGRRSKSIQSNQIVLLLVMVLVLLELVIGLLRC